jgi:hypothetical protein
VDGEEETMKLNTMKLNRLENMFYALKEEMSRTKRHKTAYNTELGNHALGGINMHLSS